MAEGIVVNFSVEMDKETKNTYRFRVVGKKGFEEINGTLYVPKDKFPDLESFKLKALLPEQEE